MSKKNRKSLLLASSAMIAMLASAPAALAICNLTGAPLGTGTAANPTLVTCDTIGTNLPFNSFNGDFVTVTINPTASISSDSGPAINLQNNSSIFNSGLITSSGATEAGVTSVLIRGSFGYISNSGTISSIQAGLGVTYGVRYLSGVFGDVRNNVGANISASITNAASTERSFGFLGNDTGITNFGTISSTNDGLGASFGINGRGVTLRNNAGATVHSSITNAASTGNNFGFFGSSARILNSGTISASSSGLGESYGIAGPGNRIFNYAGATISGSVTNTTSLRRGFGISSGGATISNSGTIRGTSTGQRGAYGIFGYGGAAITNEAGGLIEGDTFGRGQGFGIGILGLGGANIVHNINNAGTIRGDGAAIMDVNTNAALLHRTNVTNSGSLVGDVRLGFGDDSVILQHGTIFDLTVAGARATADGGAGSNSFTLQNALGETDAIAANISNFNVSGSGAGRWTLSGIISDGAGAHSVTQSGSGVLILSGNNTYTGGTTISGGTLQGEIFATGSSFGTGNITNNATLQINAADGVAGTLNQVISGTGTVTKAGTGTLILSGNNSYAGGTTISAGALQLNGTQTSRSYTVNLGSTLTIGNDERLANDAAVSLLTNNSTFNLAGFTETIGAFSGGDGAVLSLGSGSLIFGDAANTRFSGTQIDTGILTKRGTGTFTLAGTSEANDINIDGGVFQLAANDLLSDSAIVTLRNNSIFDLQAFSDTITTLNLIDGSINGTGILTAANYDLTNGTVNANLGAGTLTQNAGGTTVINGRADANTINLIGGTLQLGANDRLLDGATVAVNGGALDLRTFSDTITTLNLIDGTINGTGTLTAANYNLENGTVNANLGAGTLTQSGGGATVLAGTSAASIVNINNANLQLFRNGLGGALVGGNVALSVVNDGTLTLGGNENIGTGTFTLGDITGSGTLSGNGTLTAANYNLNSGAVNANLGAGILTSSGSVTLNGTAGAGAVDINVGTLTLGNDNRLSSDANVRLNVVLSSGATLDLNGFSQTIRSFTGGGRATIALGGGSLTFGGINSNVSFFGSQIGTGTLTKQGSGIFSLGGTSEADNVNINGGIFRLFAGDVLSNNGTVTLNNGSTFDLQGFSDTIGTLNLTDGTITGSGILTATNYNLTNGTVGARLAGVNGLTKSGDGIVFLSGNNTYTGATIIDGGTLRLNGTQASDAYTVNTALLFPWGQVTVSIMQLRYL